MTPRQREIVEYHFGIHDGVHKTWEETETHFDTTRQNISIVMQAAKAAMAKAFRAVVEAGDYPGTGEGSPEAEAARNLLRDNNGQRPR